MLDDDVDDDLLNELIDHNQDTQQVVEEKTNQFDDTDSFVNQLEDKN